MTDILNQQKWTCRTTSDGLSRRSSLYESRFKDVIWIFPLVSLVRYGSETDQNYWSVRTRVAAGAPSELRASVRRPSFVVFFCLWHQRVTSSFLIPPCQSSSFFSWGNSCQWTQHQTYSLKRRSCGQWFRLADAWASTQVCSVGLPAAAAAAAHTSSVTRTVSHPCVAETESENSKFPQFFSSLAQTLNN